MFEFWEIASLTLGKSLRMRYCFRSETSFIKLSPALTMFDARTWKIQINCLWVDIWRKLFLVHALKNSRGLGTASSGSPVLIGDFPNRDLYSKYCRKNIQKRKSFALGVFLAFSKWILKIWRKCPQADSESWSPMETWPNPIYSIATVVRDAVIESNAYF